MDRTTQRNLGCLGALVLFSGCAHLYDPLDEALTCLHCEVEAARTWHYVRRDYCDVNYRRHFGDGFRAGYVDVCRGGSGCPPTLPPRSYWTCWYRNPAGRAKTVEWFNGFSAGAAVAMQSGFPQYGQLVTAADARGDCDCMTPVEYVPPGLHPEGDGGDVPAATAPDFAGPIIHEPPSTLQPVFQPLPGPSSAADASERRSVAPFGHSLAAPLTQRASPPVPPAGAAPPIESGGSQDPSSVSVDVAPADVDDQWFGHSGGETHHPLRQNMTAPASPAPMAAQQQEPREQDSQQQKSAVTRFAPIPPTASPEGSKPREDRLPAADSPVAAPAPAGVRESEADDAFPPLEDLFLPRRDQRPLPRSTSVDPARFDQPPRSLVEAVTRIRRTSYTGPR